MKHFLLVFIFLFINLLNAQHTEKFEKIASTIKPLKTEVVDTKFGNGNQKEKGVTIFYLLDNFEYTFPTGNFKEYYKSGELYTEAEYDSYGNILMWKCYDKDGTLVIDSKTLKIDTNATNTKQFLNLGKFIQVYTYEKEFRYSYKLCKWYLFSEGQMMNNKKIGKWKKYFANGEIKKEIDY